MGEMQRRVWWRIDGSRYCVEVRFGIRVARKESGEGSREDAEALANELARRFDAVEVCEEK
jgi:hypothetical protein